MLTTLARFNCSAHLDEITESWPVLPTSFSIKKKKKKLLGFLNMAKYLFILISKTKQDNSKPTHSFKQKTYKAIKSRLCMDLTE